MLKNTDDYILFGTKIPNGQIYNYFIIKIVLLPILQDKLIETET